MVYVLIADIKIDAEASLMELEKKTVKWLKYITQTLTETF